MRYTNLGVASEHCIVSYFQTTACVMLWCNMYLGLTIFNEVVRLWNHARICSWNQPAIRNKGKVFCSLGSNPRPTHYELDAIPTAPYRPWILSEMAKDSKRLMVRKQFVLCLLRYFNFLYWTRYFFTSQGIMIGVHIDCTLCMYVLWWSPYGRSTIVKTSESIIGFIVTR